MVRKVFQVGCESAVRVAGAFEVGSWLGCLRWALEMRTSRVSRHMDIPLPLLRRVSPGSSQE